MVDDSLRQEVMKQAQGALGLQVAMIGAANGLFDTLAAAAGPLTAGALATASGMDAGYVVRWCDAAFAFGWLDAAGDTFTATDRGLAFRPGVPGSLMPIAAHVGLAGHMAERAADLMRTGHRPGEAVLGERPTFARLFGPMLEGMFGPFFERQLLETLDVYRRADELGGLAVDLGCGNGWYLRRLLARYPRLHGLGVDGFEPNIIAAQQLTAQGGLAERLTFRLGDLARLDSHETGHDRPVALIAMNRALHHVWGEDEQARASLFGQLAGRLTVGGALVIWEPAWPATREALRQPALRGLAFQNLAEHIQGNHFLRPEQIQGAMETAGLDARIHLFADGHEAVVVGTRS